jgi:glycogen operon protein
VGNFPPVWSEWNGRYRDCVRDFWRGDVRTLGEVASRFTGSSDLYEHSTRRPSSSINFLTAHDGFTLRDVVSYEQKHNDANGEDNRDGANDNRSCNYGAEGDTDNPGIAQLRSQQQRNMLAFLLLSQGVPMLLGGDEMGRTQQGNNNAYCQDNEISWFDWNHVDKELCEFTRKLIALRRDHPVFRRRRWFHGMRYHGANVEEIMWFTPGGERMQDEHWDNEQLGSLGIFLNGDVDLHTNPFTDPMRDASFYYVINAHQDKVTITLPAIKGIARWRCEFTTSEGFVTGGEPHPSGAQLEIKPRSSWLLRAAGPDD